MPTIKKVSHLSVQDLRDKSLYHEDKAPLAERIDFAWSIYKSKKYALDDRKEALQFLVYAFDISDVKNINEQLMTLMADRNKFKKTNPEYIPGKSPQHLPFDPRKVVVAPTVSTGVSAISKVRRGFLTQELLDVNAGSKKLDIDRATIFHTPDTRAAFRVNIHQGQFVKNGQTFDTSAMHSHGKAEFAAFTLNANGELSLFMHNGMRDRVAHSSMNAGVGVVAAGEVKIINGVLQTITTHSGHYKPSLFTVYRFLEYLAQKGVDISRAQVITFSDPSRSLVQLQSRRFYSEANHGDMYETPAVQIYRGIDDLMHKNIDSINAKIEKYEDRGFRAAVLKFKDQLLGSNLTEQRASLAEQLRQQMADFKQQLQPGLSATELKVKQAQLHDIITRYQEMNGRLSAGHNKSASSGQLATVMSEFKEQVIKIKAENLATSRSPTGASTLKGLS